MKEGQDWISLSTKNSLAQTDTTRIVSFKVEATSDNENYYARKAEITFIATKGEQEVTYDVSVIQRGLASLTVDTDNIAFKVGASDTKKDFNVKKIKITSNVEWNIDDFKSDHFTIDSEKSSENNSHNGTIILTTRFNDTKEMIRESFIIEHVGPTNLEGEVTTDTITIQQDALPDKLPNEKLYDKVLSNSILNFPETVIIQDKNPLCVKETVNEPFALELKDKIEWYNDKWEIVWTSDAISKDSKYTVPSTPKSIKIPVIAYYKDAPDSLRYSLDFTLYPAPKCPDSFVPKGGDNNKSGIMIAQYKEKINNYYENPYTFVFGHDSIMTANILKSDTLSYYQYENPYQKKWVYTKWTVDKNTNEEKDVRSLKTCESSVGPRSEEGEIAFSGGRMVASVPVAASADIVVVSADGTVVRHIVLPPSTTFDEPLGFENLSSGFYFVKCVIGNVSAREKFLVR